MPPYVRQEAAVVHPPGDQARLGVPYLHRRHIHGDRLNAGLGSRRRKANARNLREGNAAQVIGRMTAALKHRRPARFTGPHSVFLIEETISVVDTKREAQCLQRSSRGCPHRQSGRAHEQHPHRQS